MSTHLARMKSLMAERDAESHRNHEQIKSLNASFDSPRFVPSRESKQAATSSHDERAGVASNGRVAPRRTTVYLNGHDVLFDELAPLKLGDFGAIQAQLASWAQRMAPQLAVSAFFIFAFTTASQSDAAALSTDLAHRRPQRWGQFLSPSHRALWRARRKPPLPAPCPPCRHAHRLGER